MHHPVENIALAATRTLWELKKKKEEEERRQITLPLSFL